MSSFNGNMEKDQEKCPTMKECLQLIKQLGGQKESLESEKEEALKKIKRLEEDVTHLKNKIDQLNTQLGGQVKILDSEKEKALGIIEKLEEDVTRLKNTNDRLIETNQCLIQMASKNQHDSSNESRSNQHVEISKVKEVVQHAKAITNSYSSELELCLNQLFFSGAINHTQSSQVQAVSGDQLINSHSNVDCTQLEELENIQEENRLLRMQLKEQKEKLKAVELERDRYLAEVIPLREHYHRFRVYEEEVLHEKKEKEQQFKEKSRVLEDNEALLNENYHLNSSVQYLQSELKKWTPPQVYSQYETSSLDRRNFSNPLQDRSADRHSLPGDYQFHPGNQSSPEFKENRQHEMRYPSHVEPNQVETPKRMIGFPATEPQPHPRASTPRFQVQSSHPPNVIRSPSLNQQSVPFYSDPQGYGSPMMQNVANRPAAQMRFQATYRSEMVRGEYNPGVRPIRDRGDVGNYQQPGKEDLQTDGGNASRIGVPEEDDSPQGSMEYINAYQTERYSMTINQHSNESLTTPAGHDAIGAFQPDESPASQFPK